MRWTIIGGNLPAIHIHADSFDEALRRARRINDGYCGGYVDEDD